MGGAGLLQAKGMDATTQTTLSWIDELIDSPSSPKDESSVHRSIRSSAGCQNDEIQSTVPLTLHELTSHLISSDSEDDDDDTDSSSSPVSNDDERLSNHSLYKPIPPSSHHNLPWPAILQYMRETESEASKYFDIQHTAGTVTTCLPSRDPHRQQQEKCHFCGQPITPVSLLPDALDKEPKFCCEDLKEYIVLVTLYTKRMQDSKLHSRPGQITLESHKQQKEKKTAQERAMERMRRKQKWEETNRKLILLQNSSVMAMSHQTKVIKFSLSSPNCVNTGWMTTATTTQDTNATTTKKSRKLPLQSLSPLMMNTTNEESEEREGEGDRSLEMTSYNNPGQTLCLVLPDNTGQTYYPSGNLAVLRASIHSTVHSYIFFNDMPKSEVIGYVDDMGRAWLKGSVETSSLRFVSTIKEGFLMEGSSAGRTKLWYWTDHNSYSLYLPLIFRLNQHLSLRFNNHDDITVCVTGQQKQQKYQIKRVVTKGASKKKSTIDKETQSYRVDLEKLQYRFESHLKCFQQTVKLLAEERKHKPLLPPLRGRGHPSPPSNHRKTKSTGTVVSFQ